MKNDSIDSILERVRTIVVQQLDVKTGVVTPNARFREDLGADSLDLVELTIAFVLEFGGIMDEDSRRIRTVGELASYIQAKGRLANTSYGLHERVHASTEVEFAGSTR